MLLWWARIAATILSMQPAYESGWPVIEDRAACIAVMSLKVMGDRYSTATFVAGWNVGGLRCLAHTRPYDANEYSLDPETFELSVQFKDVFRHCYRRLTTDDYCHLIMPEYPDMSMQNIIGLREPRMSEWGPDMARRIEQGVIDGLSLHPSHPPKMHFSFGPSP